jgi:hypothetical protein
MDYKTVRNILHKIQGRDRFKKKKTELYGMRPWREG